MGVLRERVRQFREAGRVPGAEHYRVARDFLSEPLYGLWAGQTPRDMAHSAETAMWLLARGHRDEALIGAALLHDIGKGEQRTADRVLYVMADAVGAGRLLAHPGSRFEVRRAVARTVGHSHMGATMLKGTGAEDEVVRLTRLHHAPAEGDGMLELLQEADAAS
jgi:putative nucleotidyltransferase with HDIG domain